MQSFQGKSVYKGIVMGPVVVLKKNDYQVKRSRIEDADAETSRVQEAVKRSQEQLQKLYDKALKEVGEASAAIFEVHQMMLEDEDYLEAIQNMIQTEMVNAEYGCISKYIEETGIKHQIIHLAEILHLCLKNHADSKEKCDRDVR